MKSLEQMPDNRLENYLEECLQEPLKKVVDEILQDTMEEALLDSEYPTKSLEEFFIKSLDPSWSLHWRNP